MTWLCGEFIGCWQMVGWYMVGSYRGLFFKKRVNFWNGFVWCVGPGRAHTGPYGPIWAHMGPYGPLWAQKGPVWTDHLWTYHVAAPDVHQAERDALHKLEMAKFDIADAWLHQKGNNPLIPSCQRHVKHSFNRFISMWCYSYKIAFFSFEAQCI